MRRWQEDDGVHLDLRGLHPPQPMIEVLREIEGGARVTIILHMDRDPIPLYAELEERGWAARRLPRTDVVLIEITPEAAP
ncbi:MAG: DUF2249 domain-containing protein [Alphaproteobacteria bacterium]|nr:DUF2249 domain-containing protein [Alphaproteobacteria bacterium]